MSQSANPLRHRVYQILENPNRSDRLAMIGDLILIFLIVGSVTAVALETVPDLFAKYRTGFRSFDLIVTVIFTIEYAARLWSAPEGDPRCPPGGRGCAIW